MSTKSQTFLSCQRGNVAMIFALAAMPLLLATGAAVDYSRAGDVHSRLQAATDAAALGLCQADATISTADLKKRAETIVQGYLPGQSATISSITVANNPRAVSIVGALDMPTAFMKIVSKDTVRLEALSACSANETYFEIALVLDTTGSMSSTDPAGIMKMTSAKTAATNFVNYMFTTGAMPNHVKMSLVPFAASVAVSPTAYTTASWMDTGAKSSLHWQNVTGLSGQGFGNRFAIFNKLKALKPAWAWEGCLESLPYPLNTKDDAPTAANGDSYFLPLFAPDEVGNKTCTLTGSLESWCWDKANANSYINDGTGTTGTCQSDDSDQNRFTQACKYKNATLVATTREGPNWQCTSRPLSRLGTAQSLLLAEIQALTPAGQTNIHEGLMWGWRTVSPTGVFGSDASAYQTKNTKKVIVLMTDGMNTWSANSDVIGKSQYSAYGYFKNPNGTSANGRLPTGNANPSTSADARAAIDALTLEGCTNAKNKDVVIYTVGFSTAGDPIDANGLDLLSKCATAPDYAFVANDATSLISAFAKIGSGIGQLRLTN